MKKILLLVFVFCFSVSFAQTTALVEEFNYASGDLLTAHNWVQSGSSATAPIAVTSPGLTLTNYPSVAGNACTLATTGQDVYYTFSPISAGKVFLSFLLKVSTAQTGDYFIAMSPSTQFNYTARTYIKSNGSGFSFGIGKANEAATYGTTVYNYGVTYLVVIKYVFNTATNLDDAISLFVLSNLSLGATEPVTGEINGYTFSTDPTKADPATIESVTLRQGSSSNAAGLILDGIRISDTWNTSVLATDVEENTSTLPTKYDLAQNYPNPFNPSTVIKYQVPQSSFVNVSVYDILGNKISTLVNQEKAAGSYEIRFNASNLPSGIYFYTIQTGSFSQTKKMMLMK